MCWRRRTSGDALLSQLKVVQSEADIHRKQQCSYLALKSLLIGVVYLTVPYRGEYMRVLSESGIIEVGPIL
jgi:hypothetical protein